MARIQYLEVVFTLVRFTQYTSSNHYKSNIICEPETQHLTA